MQSESAVVSITFRPCSIACKWVSSGISLASACFRGSPSRTPSDPVLRHQDRLGADLQRPQGSRRIRREERVAGSRGEDDDAPFLEVPHGAPADVRLGYLLHLDRREHTGVGAVPLERLLDGEGVQHRGEHAHVVAGGAVHAFSGGGHPTVDVAAADHDRDLEPAGPHVDELAARACRRSGRRGRTPADPSEPRRRASAGRA